MANSTLFAIKLLLTIVASIIGGVTHYCYAKANYPATFRWKLRLFGVGFVAGTLVCWLLFPSTEISSLAISAVFGGSLLGYMSLTNLVKSSKTYMPSKDGQE